MTRQSPGQRLRALLASGPIQAPGVFNALVARMAEQLGYPAVYLSGAALSAATALPDVGLLTLDEFTAAARAITAVVALPLISDADTGFGEAIHVERMVRQMESSGVAAVHIEDQQLPKRCGHLSGKSLVSAESMCAKVRAATAARTDPDFVVIARTDARGVAGFDEAVRRARLYLAAGADMIFPEALETAEEFARFAREIDVPLVANMTEFGKSPNLDFRQLADMGYRLVIYPATALRAALKAAQQALAHLKQHGQQRDLLPQLLTRQELYDLLGYADYEARDQAYFGAASPASAETATKTRHS